MHSRSMPERRHQQNRGAASARDHRFRYRLRTSLRLGKSSMGQIVDNISTRDEEQDFGDIEQLKDLAWKRR